MTTTQQLSHLDPTVCERARLSRDPRFDGRFYVAVTSTGIYCRPICPAPAPRPKNVRFYPSAAAASQAGFRPCLRCRPESSPGTPAWLGTSGTVSRGLRLIEAGALDAGGVDDLAGRLGIGSRHLGRLFQRHLGASPVAVAQTRRLHFAKKLIDETDLPMADIAFAAGFGSVRRFNDVFRRTYARQPRQLRRGRDEVEVGAEGGSFSLRLPYRPPFDWGCLIGFLGPRAIPGVEAVNDGIYRRTVALDGRSGYLTVRQSPERDYLVLDIDFAEPVELLDIVGRVRRLFDLAADPAEVAGCLGRDPRLAEVVARYPGLRVPGAWDGFEIAVRAILGQQVSVKGATTLAGRLVRTFGKSVDSPRDGFPTWVFPTASVLARADVATVGMPRTRGEAIRGLARAVLSGEVTFDGAHTLDEFVRGMIAIPGIGEWTAQYVAMRALSEPDAFPASDLVLLRAAGDEDTPLSAAKLRQRSEAWRPWRAYAALYLWKRYADEQTI